MVGPLVRAAARFSIITLLASCYTYTPVEPAAVRPGMDVRARVSPAASERIAPLLGGSDARLLSGTLITNSSDTVIVEVPIVARTDASGVVQPLHQRVSIPRVDLRELETRKLDRFRTGVLAGSAAVIVGTIVFKAVQAESGKEKLPGDGGSEVLIPLFRLVR
jgi:hypothetical protein